MIGWEDGPVAGNGTDVLDDMELPHREGQWSIVVQFRTFVPFLPEGTWRLFRPLESWLRELIEMDTSFATAIPARSPVSNLRC